MSSVGVEAVSVVRERPRNSLRGDHGIERKFKIKQTKVHAESTGRGKK